jgi:EpsI family protein
VLLGLLPLASIGSAAVSQGPVRLASPHIGDGWVEALPSEELLEAAAQSRADATLPRAWTGDGARIELLLLYYRHERQGTEAVGTNTSPLPPDSWRDIGQIPARLPVDGKPIDALGRLHERAGDRRTVFTWYWADGRFTANGFAAKLRQVRARLFGRSDASARLQLILSGAASQSEMESVLGRFLADLEPMGPLLEQAGHGSP